MGFLREFPAWRIIFFNPKKMLDSSEMKSIIRFFSDALIKEQEVIMKSKANYFDTADLVNIHIPVT
jgi:hypothetical protein